MDTTTRPTDKRSWEVTPGTPGAILPALVAAARAIGTLSKREDLKKTMAFKAIEDVLNAVNPVLQEQGVVTLMDTADVHVGAQGKAGGAILQVHVTFYASADGTFVSSSVHGAATAGMGRHVSVAIASALKQIFSVTLQLSTGAPPDEKQWRPEDEPDEVQQWWHAIESALTRTELKAAVSPLGASQAAKEHARHLWRVRKDQLVQLDAGEYRAEMRATASAGKGKSK